METACPVSTEACPAVHDAHCHSTNFTSACCCLSLQNFAENFYSVRPKWHCVPYSGAFTLALRPCKKNLNPKPEFYFVKTQNPGLDKEPRVHKTLVTVTKAINKLCYSPHLTSTEDDAVEVNNFKDARSTQSINSTFYSSVDSTQLQHHMNDLIDPVHRF